jgi:hypothetical protein
MLIVSIDIGYYNLGFVKATVGEDGIPHVHHAQKVDITMYTHTRVPFCDCTLHHTREMADYVMHFIQEFREHFDEADRVLVERQPPGGFGAIEALILATFREKTQIISPNAMHKHFNIGHLDYEHRKIKTQEIAEPYLCEIETYTRLTRKHDVSDAMCMILYQIPRAPRPKNIVNDFEVFRFIKQ